MLKESLPDKRFGREYGASLACTLAGFVEASGAGS
jgi:hypothetical protein